MQPQYLAVPMESVECECRNDICGELTMLEACSFAAALNTGALQRSELHWTIRDNNPNLAHGGWCVLDTLN